ncbi:uncharacterized protein phf11 [Nematolebias whitei]|uniref:uncharacterized protein phf11 n=1 Tax=Nematolebias whitei TaxID=451745 RepID=UPI001899B3A1|nr:uncharacterized protein phf11 [Nematolebias whitei]
MSLSGRACCLLCQRSEETKITGPLSTKEDVTAHQNCLLFSSGIFCSNTPQFDDLFGFSVQDVKVEVSRGRKLFCPWCKKRGGTSGCELRRCKKSFHYPCAIEEGARTFQDKKNEKYGLYCLNHKEEENVDSAKGSKSSKKSSEASPSQVVLLSLHKRKSNGAFSDSSNTTLGSLKRRLSFTDQIEEQSTNKKTKKRNRITSVDSSDSALAELIPPLESDLEESGSFLTQQQSPEPQFNGKYCEGPSGPSVEYQVEVESTDVNAEDITFTDSDAESDSLLQPFLNHISSSSDIKAPTQTVQADIHWAEKEVQTIKKELDDFFPAQSPTYRPEVYTSKPAVPEQNLNEPPLSPKPAAPQSPSSSSSMTMALCKPICVTPLSSSPPSPPQAPVSDKPHSQPQAPSSDPVPIVDSASFWRNCNAASCTQTIFSEFINEMNEISSRILSDQASQEDYNRALSVMMASGKLAEFVSKQQEAHMEGAAIRCGAFWTRPVLGLRSCSQAVEVLPSPLLLQEERRRSQLQKNHTAPRFSPSYPPVCSGWTSGEDAESEDELWFAPVHHPHRRKKGRRRRNRNRSAALPPTSPKPPAPRIQPGEAEFFGSASSWSQPPACSPLPEPAKSGRISQGGEQSSPCSSVEWTKGGQPGERVGQSLSAPIEVDQFPELPPVEDLVAHPLIKDSIVLLRNIPKFRVKDRRLLVDQILDIYLSQPDLISTPAHQTIFLFASCTGNEQRCRRKRKL